MSTMPEAEPVASTPAPPQGAPSDAEGSTRVRKIARNTVVVLIVLFVYHVIADRITPYTSQATVDTFLVQIAPQVSGPVMTVEVADNRSVKLGQLLFQVDPAPFQIALRAAQANLAVAMQNADASTADLRVAQAALSRQRTDLAASQSLGKIVLDLSARHALSETSAIRARAEIAKSQADLARAEAEVDRARTRMGETGSANAQVRQAQSAVDQAALDLRNSRVLAPADGVVTNLRLAPGQFVNRGQPALSFIADGPRWVTAAMSENQLGNIAPGQRALIVLDDRPGKVFAAHVESVGWGVTQGGETPNGQLPRVNAPSGWLREPQRFLVRIVLDPPTDRSTLLPPGRSGAQGSVVVLTRERSWLNPFARLWIWSIAMLSYLR